MGKYILLIEFLNKILKRLLFVVSLINYYCYAQYDTVTISFPPLSSGTTGTWVSQTFTVSASSLPNAPGSAPFVFQDQVYTLKSIWVKAQKSLPYLQLQIKAPGGQWMSVIDEFGTNRTAAGSLQHMETWFISRHYGGGNPRPQYVNDDQAADCKGGSPWNIGNYGCGAALPTTGGTGVNYDGDFRLLDTWGANIAGTWEVRIRNWSGISSGFTTNSNPPELQQLKLVFGKNFPANTGVGGDHCSNAFELTNIGIFSNNTSGFTGGPTEDPRLSGVNPCAWNASFDNTVWFTFVAQSTTFDFILSGVNCQGGNQMMQAIVVTGTPGDPNPCALNGMTGSYWELNPVTGGCPTDYYGGVVSSAGYCNGRAVNTEFHLSNLTIGQRYFIVIDGNASANCSFVIDVTSGLPNPFPTCNVNAGNDTSVCPGQTITLASSDTTNCTSIQWTTSGDGTFSNSSVLHPVYTPGTNDIANGTVYLTLTAQSSCGVLKDSLKLSIVSALTVSAGNDTTICIGQQVVLTATQGTSYLWSNGSTTQSITVSPAAATTYSVTVSNNGCTGTADVTVDITTSPTISVSPQNPVVCVGGSVQLTASGASTYVWSPSSGLSATTGSSISCTPSQTTTYTVTGSIGPACNNTATVTVSVTNNFSVNITADPAQICVGASTTLTANGASSYTWSPAVGLSSTSGQTITASPTATQTYTVTGTSGANCISTSSVTITVNPNPVFTVNASPSQLCPGGSSTLTASGNHNYVWAPATGLSATTGSSVTATPTGNSVYTVTATSSNGCTSTQSVSLTILPLPQVAAQASPTQVCAGTTSQLTASGAAQYVWSPAATLSASTGTVVIATPTQNTVYSVTGTDGNGCSNTATVQLSVFEPVDITLSSSQAAICFGNSTSLNTTMVNNGGGSPYTYQWAPGVSSTGSSVVVSPTTTTIYSVTITDRCGSTDEATVSVTVNPLPVPQFSIQPSSACERLQSYFTDLTQPTPVSWSWNFGDPASGTKNTSVLQNPSHYYSKPGYYTVSLTVTDANGCSGSITLHDTIKIYPGIVADFRYEPENPTEFEPTVDFYDQSNGAISWLWNFGYNQYPAPSVYTQQNPTWTYTAPGNYEIRLIVQNQWGCKDTIVKSVKVTPDFAYYIPNTITPNDNGLNDEFGLFGWGILHSNFEMLIFNRWGEIIFKTNDLNQRWDGSYNGNKVPNGVYVYLIKFQTIDSTVREKAGWVLVTDSQEYGKK